MSRLMEHTKILRSKNAGPLFITFDLIFSCEEEMDYVLQRLKKEDVAALYGVAAEKIDFSYESGKTGVLVLENGQCSYYEHAKLSNGCHGTGDIYASAFVGALMRGKPTFDAARIAADFTRYFKPIAR